jgi:hypothetical protein
LAVLVGLVSIAVPSLGLSSSTPNAAKQGNACGRVEFVSGLEAVFGRFKSHQQALTFRTKITGVGFVNANIIEGCSEFRVVIRGIDTFDVGVDLQDEARKEGFAVTLECIQAKQIGRWEAILGHGRDRAAANAIVARAATPASRARRCATTPVAASRSTSPALPTRQHRPVRRDRKTARLQRRDRRAQLAAKRRPSGPVIPRHERPCALELKRRRPCGQATRCRGRHARPQSP